MTPEEEIRLECLKLVATTASAPFSLAGILVAADRVADFVINGVPPEKVEPAPAIGREAWEWNKEQDDVLRQMATEGISAQRIAGRLNRTKAAVQKRKSILGLTKASPGRMRSVVAMHAALAAKRAAA